MKKIKTLAFIMAFAVIMQIPFNAFAATTTYSPFVKSNYTQQDRMAGYTISHGLDLSYHNGEVDFAKLKSAGVEYVILRVGYRGYGDKGTIGKDKKFEEYYDDAVANGMKIGAYFYSQALNTTEAKAEANAALEKIAGRKMDLPVYYDYEFAGVSDGRLDKAWNNGTINKTKMTANAKAFCDTIKSAGYFPGIYASTYFFYDQLDYASLEGDYAIWDAHYATKTTYKGQFQIWQYSAKGIVKGTDSTYVDSNFMYVELMNERLSNSEFKVASIKSKAYTGSEIKPSLDVKVGKKSLVKGEDYYVTFTNNIEIGKAYVTVTGINNYASYAPLKVSFKIVPSKVLGIQFTGRTADSVSLKWDEHSDADRYRIQVLDGTAYKTLKELTDTSYTVNDLEPAESVTLRVCAIKKISGTDYVGKYSDVAESAAKPAKVKGLKNTTKNTDSIKLMWNKQPNASYYNVFELNSASGEYELIKKASKNYFTAKGLKRNSKHTFKVQAVKVLSDSTVINGSRSAEFTAYTSPLVPESITAKSNATKRISVKWKQTAGVSGYEVMWSTTKGFTSNCATIINAGKKNVTRTLKTAQANKTYYVRVRSYKTHDTKRIYSKWSKGIKVKVK